MKINQEAIKLLAQKMGSSPEWTGPNGVFVSRFSRYDGVIIFAEYTKHLRVTNRNRIPDSLPHRVHNYIEYLEAKPEEFKTKYKQFYKHTVPRIREMIRLGKMTMDSILLFANIFNDLEIGYKPATVVADYQSAVSQAINFKAGNSQRDDQTTDNSARQNYQMMVLSDKEKKDVIEKCRKKGVLISETDVDYIYYGENDGGLYYGDGNPIENAAIGIAIAETLPYQVANGDAERLDILDEKISEIITVYIDKDGNLYENDGTPITDTSLITAISQTGEYAEKRAKMADRREKPQIFEGAQTSQDSLDFSNSMSERMQAGISFGGIGSVGIESEGAVNGEIDENNENQLAQILNGKAKLPEPIKSHKHGKHGIRSNGDGTRGGRKSNKNSQSQVDQESQDTNAQNANAQNPAGSKQNQAGGGNEQIPQDKKKGMSLQKKVCCGAGAGVGLCTAKVCFGATLFSAMPLIDNHYFISSILKILFQ